MQDMQGHYLDMEGFDSLSFRLKGDGRKYIASIRVDNWIVGSTSHDVWQAFLFAR
jgi:NADH dehydrogenase [ubiquinone] 1 alpha subcomplex assembly factor 1